MTKEKPVIEQMVEEKEAEKAAIDEIKSQPLETEKENETSEEVATEKAEEVKEEPKGTDVDYEAELKVEEKKVHDKKGFEGRTTKEVKDDEDDLFEDDPKGLSKDEVMKMIADNKREVEVSMTKEHARSYAREVATSPEHEKLIMHYYENRIVPTGDIREDIELATLLSNKTKLNAEIKEAYKAAASNSTKGKGTGSGGKAPVETKVAYSTDEQKMIQGLKLKIEGGEMKANK